MAIAKSQKATIYACIVMWVLVLISSVLVIYVTYETRKQFNALEVLRLEKNALQVTWRQYMLEESTWAAYSRIERLATGQLGMYLPPSDQMIVVEDE